MTESLVGAVYTDTDLRQILCVEETCSADDLLQILPFSEESLTPVGYDLRVGEQYTSTKLGKTDNVAVGGEIVIPPGDTCLVTTLEIIGMPKSKRLSGLVVSTVSMVARGLSHVSTSIDPDWSGKLMIVLHNHAPHDVRLKVGERLCTAIVLSNRTPSTKLCGVFAGRDDLFRNRLLEATRRSRRRREALTILFILLIPLGLLGGYTLFGNDSGMIATTAAFIAMPGMLFTFYRDK